MPIPDVLDTTNFPYSTVLFKATAIELVKSRKCVIVRTLRVTRKDDPTNVVMYYTYTYGLFDENGVMLKSMTAEEARKNHDNLVETIRETAKQEREQMERKQMESKRKSVRLRQTIEGALLFAAISFMFTVEEPLYFSLLIAVICFICILIISVIVELIREEENTK